MLLQAGVRAAGGAWGDALRSGVGGATGVLAVIVAVLIIFVGVDLFLALTPTTLIRRGTHKGVAGVQRAVHGGLRVRRDVRSRAAFGADVALVQKRLKGLSADLGALGELYPGSAELEHWRSAAKTAHANLRYADAPILEHTETDVRAWEGAVGGFTDARAAEIRGQIGDEGVRGFEGTQADLGDALAEPFADRTLDGLRKVLGLEHTALGERYNRLVRDREGAAEALREADAKGLVRASRRHAERLAQFREVSASQAAIVADAALLAPWADLLGRVDDARADLPNDPALAAFGAELRDGIVQTLGEPPGRLEEHARATLAGQTRQPGPSRGLLARREALEAEPVRRQARHRERRRHRRRGTHPRGRRRPQRRPAPGVPGTTARAVRPEAVDPPVALLAVLRRDAYRLVATAA